MRAALQTIAVAALLVLAGCSGGGGPATTVDSTTAPTTDQPTTSVQPTQTTQETTTQATDSSLPPGVTSDGVANASALVAAHRDSVTSQGAVVVTHTRVTDVVDNQSVSVVSNGTVHLSPGADRFRRVVTGTTTQGNETRGIHEAYYANETTVVVRVLTGDANRTRTVDRTDVYDQVVNGSATNQRVVETVLASANFTVAGTEQRNGRTVTTLVAENGTYSGPRSLTSYDATLEVAASGRVLSLERTGTWTTNGTELGYDNTYSWRPAEPIDPPEWLPRNDSDSD